MRQQLTRLQNQRRRAYFIPEVQMTVEQIEKGAKALAEWHAPNSWDTIGDELKKVYRTQATVVLEAAEKK